MGENVDIKQQRHRERIGLIVFIVAILGIFAAVFGYIMASHSLDLAASGIDENVGQLDGYLTIIFEGDNTPRVEKTSTTEKILKQATEFFIGDDSKTTTSEPQTDKDIKTEKATTENVRDFYKDKDSTVCKIKCSDYAAYTSGEVFERGYWKIGVLSVTPEILSTQTVSTIPTQAFKAIQERIYKLRYEDEVDLVVVLSPDQKITKYIDKVDCAICKTVTDDIPDEGKTVDNIFVMRVPNVGIIGTVLSSPAKMLQGHVYSKVEIKKDEEESQP